MTAKKNWPAVKLGEVLHKSKDWIEIDPVERYKEVTVRLWGRGVAVRGEIDGAEIAGSRRVQVRTGQFILSRIDARNGAFGLIPKELDGGVVTNDFPVYNADVKRLSLPYLEWMSKTRWFVATVKESSEGTTNRVRLKEDKFQQIEIPLPPVSEQRRIVARLDDLVGKVNQARQLRAEADEESRAFLASCLETILDKHKSRHRQAVLGDLADIKAGITLGRKMLGPTIALPYLRVANVQDSRLDLSEVKTVELYESERSKWKLEYGDLLLTEGGDWDKLGRGTIWRNEIPDCIHQNHIFRLRFDSKVLLPEFAELLIRSPSGKRFFRDASKQTTNLASINQKQLKSFPVFVPPVSIQRQILSDVKGTETKCESMRLLQMDTAIELDALIPSLLDRAFKGEL